MPKLYAYLCGGMGNQMFQYAMARSLGLKSNCELVLDTWSGFVRDVEYHRHYELHALPIQARIANSWELPPIWLYRIDQRIRGQIKGNNLKENYCYGQFLIETEFKYLGQVKKTFIGSSTWLVGYWQSPLYFQEYTNILLKELMPKLPSENKFLSLGEKLRQVESVAVGVRLYEESKNPSIHARYGRLKTTEDINLAISQLSSQCPNAEFFVFCTHRSPLLERLDLPQNTVFVTHDEGYKGTLETLWLLSQCRHHLFTNSSYYWWGAWLSQQLYSGSGQVIFAADNFINSDGLCDGWVRF
ncbi:MAG: alpha-1,2-fucosyltransferase [Cyanobacteria bacterium LVE1205-1]|jgi:hypothetical protein